MTIIQRAVRIAGVMILLMSPGSSFAEPPVHEIQVVASRYQFEPATIQVNAGESVRLLIRSADGSHGFGIPTLKIDAYIPKGGEAVAVGHARMKAARVSVAGPTRTTR